MNHSTGILMETVAQVGAPPLLLSLGNRVRIVGMPGFCCLAGVEE